MTTLTVGSGQQYATIAGAVAASHDGDVIQVQAGTYVNDFAEIGTKVTLEGVGGMVHMVATVAPPNGKAILTTDTDVTVDHFEFSGAAVSDLNGAGIRQQGGKLVVLDSYFHDNQMGILTNADPNATLTIRNSEFAANVASGNTPASGLTHNVYVGAIAQVTVDNSYFHDATLGHEFKSRAAETIITNSRFADLDSTASYSIDLPNGGHAVLSHNVIEQGAHSDNPTIVAFGEEGTANGGQWANSSLTMQGNTILNDLPGGLLLWNSSGAPASLTDTHVYGLSASQLVSGPASQSNTTYLTTEPGFDTSHPWTSSTTPTPTPPPVAITPSLSVSDASGLEGAAGTANALSFTVTLSAPAPTGGVVVSYATQNGTALAGSDYVASSGSLSFAAGETSKTVAVKLIGDATVEPNESFSLVLANPHGATLAHGTGTGTILNDDVAPAPSVNTITGTDQANTLTGTAGADRIIGLKGNDVMTGNAGADTFVFRQGDGFDKIKDFHAGEDHLEFQGITAAQVTTKLAIYDKTIGLNVTYDTAGDHVFLPHVYSLGAKDMIFS